MLQYIVYIRTCLVSNKSYVGYTSETLESRWDKGKGYGSIMLSAIKKYGVDCWDHKILCYCDTEDNALFIEAMLIKEYNTIAPHGYNILPHGRANPMKTELGRLRCCEARKGQYTDKQKAANALKIGAPAPWMDGDNNPMKNPEVAARMGAVNKGRKSPSTTGDKHHMRKNKELAKQHADKIKGRITVNNGVLSRCIYPAEAEKLLALGWFRGLLKGVKKS
jgi:group I intron endonuclease